MTLMMMMMLTMEDGGSGKTEKEDDSDSEIYTHVYFIGSVVKANFFQVKRKPYYSV